ncbi:DUF3570 domain-containing protein [Psychroserpens ponticola]|uniref:DUF3570 domain-containing protein n=1 Tax=Psychroserpens ponticola TaxID=2932268 RepID=A0ABY7S2Q2_9FLAO|nr:DUF3570 domain-containing protein [Psychroserpens ponticola]WCO03272.1 DUF3570 domain-containing protein [Psychroserpens ponticola]
MKNILIILLILISFHKGNAQDSTSIYKKRVLETAEVDFLTSYYTQDGDNAAVSGGIGTEELTDITGTFIVSIPLNDDDILTIDAGVSAYTSASSSNINPFDGGGKANPFDASSGASQGDVWANLTGSYTHNSNDRNDIWSAKLSVSSEFDYFSIGVGGSYTKLFNEKNTEVSINGNIFIDTWNALYPTELRPFADGQGLNGDLFNQHTITGNSNYNPEFKTFDSEGRNTYALGFGFSQILSKKLQGSLVLDFVKQDGLLSTPFQRVYFKDVADSFIEEFHLADDVERLPNSRFKIALGGRLHYYINETFVLRTFYRYYLDDWGIKSHTANIEIPIKLSDKFTIYPSYRFYNQSAADYFAKYEAHISTNEFYTSDYDLSEYSANQFSLGATYTDIFTKFHLWKLGLKSIDLKYTQYDRDNTLSANIISAGFKFVLD